MTANVSQPVRCARCHRVLTDPRRAAAGIGRTCAKRRRQEAIIAASTVTPAQVAKAVELIELRAARRQHGPRPVFDVISSNGVDRYITTPDTCTCPAGQHGRYCYHRLAVALIAA